MPNRTAKPLEVALIGCVFAGGAPGAALSPPDGFFYSSSSICTPEHGGTHLVAPPMKIAGGSGGPVRVIALVAP